MIELQKTSYLDHTIRPESLNGDAFTDEQGAHKFIITCYQHGERVNLTGTISGRFMRPGGTVALTGSVSNGQAVIALTSECYQRNGSFLLTVFNTVGETRTVIYACSGNVRRSSSEPLIDGGEIIDSVENLIADIEAAVATIPQSYTELETQTNEISLELSTYQDTGKSLLSRGNFQRRLYNPSIDDLVPGYNNRISARKVLNFGYDVTLNILSGFRVYPWFYINGAWTNNSIGWKTDTYTISANTDFYLYIAKLQAYEEEHPAEVADVSEYLPAVTIVQPENGYYYVDQFRKSTDTDDTQAITRALSAAGSYGTVVFQADKTYNISNTINVSNPHVKLLSMANAMHTPVIKAVSTATSPWWMFNVSADGVSFANLTIEGNGNTYGVQLKRTSGGVNPDSIADLDAFINRCYFRNQLNGIAAYGRNLKVEGSHFSGCNNGVVLQEVTYTDGGTNYYANIRGWIVKNCRFHGMGHAIYETLGEFTNIDTIKNHGSWCIKNLATHVRQSDNVFSENLIDGVGYAGFYYGQGDGCRIYNNTTSGDMRCEILAYISGGSTSGKERCIIKDNIFTATRSDAYTTGESSATYGNATPIYIDGGAHVTIQGNYFSDYGSTGVYINSGRGVKVIGNVFDGVCYDTDIGAVYYNSASGNSNLDLSIAHNTVLRESGRTGTVSLVNATAKVNANLSKYNCTQNITNNIEA